MQTISLRYPVLENTAVYTVFFLSNTRIEETSLKRFVNYQNEEVREKSGFVWGRND